MRLSRGCFATTIHLRFKNKHFTYIKIIGYASINLTSLHRDVWWNVICAQRALCAGVTSAYTNSYSRCVCVRVCLPISVSFLSLSLMMMHMSLQFLFRLRQFFLASLKSAFIAKWIKYILGELMRFFQAKNFFTPNEKTNLTFIEHHFHKYIYIF